MSNTSADMDAFVREWAELVMFSNTFLADPQGKDLQAFKNYRQAHDDDARIPVSKHGYFNKLWHMCRR